MTPSQLDTAILDTLRQTPMHLRDLAQALSEDARDIKRRLLVMEGQRKVMSTAEAGRLVWDLYRTAPAAAKPPRNASAKPPRKAAPPRPVKPLHERGSSARKSSQQQARTDRHGGERTGLTNAIRRVLAAAGKPMLCAEVVAALSQFNAGQVGTILSQRVKAGELECRPRTGKPRRYALAGTFPPAHEPSANASTAPPSSPPPHTQALIELELDMRASAGRLLRQADTIKALREGLDA